MGGKAPSSFPITIRTPFLPQVIFLSVLLAGAGALVGAGALAGLPLVTQPLEDLHGFKLPPFLLLLYFRILLEVWEGNGELEQANMRLNGNDKIIGFISESVQRERHKDLTEREKRVLRSFPYLFSSTWPPEVYPLPLPC